jgi:hypothetical protein
MINANKIFVRKPEWNRIDGVGEDIQINLRERS